MVSISKAECILHSNGLCDYPWCGAATQGIGSLQNMFVNYIGKFFVDTFVNYIVIFSVNSSILNCDSSSSRNCTIVYVNMWMLCCIRYLILMVQRASRSDDRALARHLYALAIIHMKLFPVTESRSVTRLA